MAGIGDQLAAMNERIAEVEDRRRVRREELDRAIISENWSEVKQFMRGKPHLVNETLDDVHLLHTARAELFGIPQEDVCVMLLEGATRFTLDLLDPKPWVGRSLLHLFSQRGFAECVTCVLEKSRKRVNKQDKALKQTPLHVCAVTGLTFQQHFKVISALLSSRADIAIKDKDGKTAAELYESNKCELYDENKKEEEKHQLLHLLRGEIPHQILLKGSDTILIYVKALEEASEIFEKCSVSVVGQARAGKTSLIKKLTGQRFNSKEEETDGIVTTKICKIDENDKKWKLETKSDGKGQAAGGLRLKIYDFAGQERYYTTHQVFLMSRAVFILVFDLTLDLNAKALIEIRGDDRFKNFPEWMVKAATFLGWKKNVKVYELDMTNLSFITYWLSSIYAHTEENRHEDGTQAKQLSPPVFIVGTHKHSLPGNKSRKDTKVKEIFDIIRGILRGKPYENHVVTMFYAVDSSLRNDEEIQKLQSHILKVVQKQPYMNELVPASWMGFERALNEKREENVHWIRMTEVSEIATRCKVNASELPTLLQFQHDTGNCVHFGNTANADDPLNLYVILNQMWLNDIFRGVITIKPAQDQHALFRTSWDRLASQGLLDEKLARHVWREYKIDPNLLFGLMSRFDLLCEMQFSVEESARSVAEGTRVFCLPCCLSETIEAPTVVEDDNCIMRFFVDFAGFLPGGLFFRLMVRAIRFSQECGGHDQRLSRHSAEVYVDQDHHLVQRIFSKDRSFMEVIIVRVADDGANPSPAVCQMIYDFLVAALRDLCNTWSKGVKFTFGIPCDQCHDETDKLHLHTFDECTRALRVSCKGRRMNTERFQHLFVKGFDHVYLKETKNFQAIDLLVTDHGTKQMRMFFLRETKLDRADVGNFLIHENQKGSFKGARVFAEQKKKLFIPDADIDQFDITILMMIIRHCCKISPTPTDEFWKCPDEHDNSELANLVRIREYRNMQLAHNHNKRMTTNEFEDEWKKLTAIFLGIGVAPDDIDKYRQIAS